MAKRISDIIIRLDCSYVACFIDEPQSEDEGGVDSLCSDYSG